jgi:hypothetical protein
MFACDSYVQMSFTILEGLVKYAVNVCGADSLKKDQRLNMNKQKFHLCLSLLWSGVDTDISFDTDHYRLLK